MPDKPTQRPSTEPRPDAAADGPVDESRRRILRATLAVGGTAALGHLPYRSPAVKSFFGVRSAYAQGTDIPPTTFHFVGPSPEIVLKPHDDPDLPRIFLDPATITVCIDGTDVSLLIELEDIGSSNGNATYDELERMFETSDFTNILLDGSGEHGLVEVTFPNARGDVLGGGPDPLTLNLVINIRVKDNTGEIYNDLMNLEGMEAILDGTCPLAV